MQKGELAAVNVALFPLQLVAYPGEELALHIFEPRYRQMIALCEAEGVPFGIVAVHEGRVATTGTLMVLTQVVQRYDDGRLDIRVMGTQPFEVLRFAVAPSGDEAHRADVRLLQVGEGAEAALRERVERAYLRFHELIQNDRLKPVDLDRPLSYQIAHLTALAIPQKIELLGLTDETERLDYLLRHLMAINPTLELVESVRQKVRQNGAFKALPGADFDFGGAQSA